MSDKLEPDASSAAADHRRVAAGQFERANEVLASGNAEYAIQLLNNCCKMDPGSLIYRKALRKAQKTLHKDNQHGSKMSFLTNSPAKTKLKAARAARDHLRVLEYGEEILGRNPWDTGALMDMAHAADALDFLNVAVWLLEQAHRREPQDLAINRALARLYEKGGQYTQAIALWDFVRKTDPKDVEAQHKGQELAVHETIVRGNYGSATGPAAAESPGPVVRSAPESHHASATEERIDREALGIRKRIEGDPGNALPYLQLATLYRRADLLEKALWPGPSERSAPSRKTRS
jgi:tetratricopeptide (TPR) repeat protein